MKQFLIIGSVALSATFASATALADDENVYFAPMIGAVITDNNTFETGLGGYAILGVDVDDKWSFEGTINYSDVTIDSVEAYRRGSLTVGVLRDIHPDLISNYLPSIEPFITASLATTRTQYVDITDYAPGAEFGVGFRRPVEGEDYRYRVDLRYRFDAHRGVEEFGNDLYYSWALMFGVEFGTGSTVEFGHSQNTTAEPTTRPTMATAEAQPYEQAPAATVLPSISFPLDSAQLTRKAKETLDQVIEILEAQPDLNVVVVGHADDTGPSEYNLQLSESRAQEAMDYIVDRGIDPTRISLSATGEDAPVASNATADGRRENRRVSFEAQ